MRRVKVAKPFVCENGCRVASIYPQNGPLEVILEAEVHRLEFVLREMEDARRPGTPQGRGAQFRSTILGSIFKRFGEVFAFKIQQQLQMNLVVLFGSQF